MTAMESIVQVVRRCVDGVYLFNHSSSSFLGRPTQSQLRFVLACGALGVLLVSLFGDAVLGSSNVTYEVDL